MESREICGSAWRGCRSAQSRSACARAPRAKAREHPELPGRGPRVAGWTRVNDSRQPPTLRPHPKNRHRKDPRKSGNQGKHGDGEVLVNSQTSNTYGEHQPAETLLHTGTNYRGQIGPKSPLTLVMAREGCACSHKYARKQLIAVRVMLIVRANYRTREEVTYV